jgi:hypothetical protein
MSSVKAKLAQAMQNPEEAAEMDASIREAQRSRSARQMVTEVRAAVARGLSPADIRVQLATMAEEYPRLFDMVLDPAHSPAMLDSMLQQLEAVEAGRRSTHDASVMVGTMLVNSFVRPKLGMEPVPLPGSATQPGRPSSRDISGSPV